MVNWLLSALIPIVLEKVRDSLVQRIGEVWGINDQRERLHNLLLEIQAVLQAAEDQAKSNAAVKSWLEKLKSAAYDADDLIDEFCYEELRRDAVRRGQKLSKISRFFSHENPALFQYKMSGKLKKLVGRIDGLVVQMGRFGFGQGQRVEVSNQDKTDSHVVESKIVGRDEDKEKIVKLLLEAGNSADLMVVPVVGMGGLGKSTLAQLVYNDPRVKEHFKLLLWVFVSTNFNIDHILKSIIDLIIQKNSNVPTDNRELLKRRLHQVLCGKRYLLVLDDVWNENANEWERLRDLLDCGDPGNAVIVTTRSGKVASIMGTVESYNLKCLGEEDSWNLFRKKSFNIRVKENRELVEIGRKMVQNCKGLPLAINTLGSLMSYKHNLQEWSAVLEESKIWATGSANNDVLPVLRLSYDHLPPYMKQCFAFCAVFPKGYEMNKEKLIQYWMANGFIPYDGLGSLETKGSDIFNELAWRSFFQDVEQGGLEYGHNSKITCKMHDLMHDLAKSIMGDECLSTLEVPTHLNQPNVTVRHISIENISVDINNTTNCFPSIRTLISTSEYVPGYVCNIGFLKSNSLRVLELNVNPIMRTMVTPEKMKHLRYLEVSGFNIASLPEAISTLYLLQTLRLSKCWNLVKLPDGMKYMSSLRHLDIERRFSLKSMPSGLGQLNNLQMLTTYIVGTDDGNGIEELKNLNLHGKLHLYNIREVRDVVNARQANLVAKLNLDALALCWGMPDDYRTIDFEVAESNVQEVIHCNPHEVMDALKPCNNLKVLRVTQYMGDEFPVWMTEYSVLENLIELYIIDCRNCTKIPPVDKLPFLKILDLKFLNNLRHLFPCCSNSEERGKDTQVAFPSLDSLVLSEMPNLISWCESEVGKDTSLVFPVLKRLDIINCPKLIAMPSVPSLEDLSVKGNKTLSCFATRLTTLQGLSLESYHGYTESPNESLSFQTWGSLYKLYLNGYNSIAPIHSNEGEEKSVPLTRCRSLEIVSCNFISSIDIASNSSLWFWKCFMFLEILVIKYCDNLIYWPIEELRSLNCLKNIYVCFCPNFIGSQEESSSARSITEALLPKLEFICVVDCPNVVEIPNCSTSIQEMIINGCSNLIYLPEWLGSMVALRRLYIADCENLHSLPSSIGGLMSLEELEIDGCPNLVYVPEGMEGLNALKVLKIRKCPKIRVLPGGLLQQLMKLDELWIECCPHLERHFRRCGKYWRLTSEVQLIKIGDLVQQKHYNLVAEASQLGVLAGEKKM